VVKTTDAYEDYTDFIVAAMWRRFVLRKLCSVAMNMNMNTNMNMNVNMLCWRPQHVMGEAAVVSICNGLFMGRNGRARHTPLWLNRHTRMQLRGASRGLPDPASFPPRLDTALVTVGFRLGQGRELEMQYVDRRLSPFVRRRHRLP
jgi:hypothetical protein